MIDTRKLKELVRLMVENDLAELDLRDQEETVTIKRTLGGAIAQGGGQPIYLPAPHAAAPAPQAAASTADVQPAEDTSGLVAVTSPMVGTYYSRPNPDADAFTTVGANVGPDTVVCLLEAMKVFNEIKAEHSGTVERILVKDGDAVEFGQDLMLIRPS